MPADTPRVSAALQALIDKGLLDGLPLSFSAFCFDQMKDWDLLFPAERSYFERLFGLLDRSSPPAVAQLFQPIREIELKMGMNQKTFPKGRFTLEQVDFLNRNPFYPEWRAAVAKVFAQLDPPLDAEIARAGHARLAIVIAPSQLPADPDRMWTRFEAPAGAASGLRSLHRSVRKSSYRYCSPARSRRAARPPSRNCSPPAKRAAPTLRGLWRRARACRAWEAAPHRW